MTKTLGLSFEELAVLDEGQVIDMLIEKGNDDVKYKQLATQADFDRF